MTLPRKSLAVSCRRVVGRFRVFSSVRDALAYWGLAKCWLPGPRTVSLRVRDLAMPMRCRPQTSDTHTLFVAMYDRFHLPPVPLRDDSVILDLGANAGYTVAHLASLYPRSRIIGVEMDEGNFEIALANVRPFMPRCQLVHAAVWSEDGWITYAGRREEAFRVSQLGPEPAGPPEPAERPQRARAVSLNSLFDRFWVDRVDYVKMDIEGAEHMVLTHATEWMDRVLSMKVEIHPPATVERVIDTLGARGFRCSKDPHHPACVVAVRPRSAAAGGRTPA